MFKNPFEKKQQYLVDKSVESFLVLNKKSQIIYLRSKKSFPRTFIFHNSFLSVKM